MSKELLEELIIEFDEMGYEPTILCDAEKEIESFRNRLKQVLDYLKSLDTANPSEALKCLDDISYLVLNEIEDLKNKELWKSYFTTIKQSLLKAQENENTRVVGGRTFGKEIVYLKQSIEQCNDKPIFYTSRTYGNKYIVPQKQLDDLTNENTEYKKVLDIINKKNVDIVSLKNAVSVKEYNSFISFRINYMEYMKFTKEEFDLLKKKLG